MEKRMAEAGSLKPGKFILIDGEPCKVVSSEKSKAGKHGHAKVRIVAIGFFDNSKRSVVFPANATVEIPVIDKRSGQVISISENAIMVMDMESYQTFEMPMPTEEDLKSKIEVGAQVEYWDVAGKKKIMRVKSA
ncbi:MAG: translation initiation factor IF-5A [Candidatus Odinarchaeia archaeon]